MKWNREKIVLDNGKIVEGQAPIIISASRATDIPAFYFDWFINRLKKGYIKWLNPYNNLPYYISLKQAKVIVFWTKNANPVFKHLDYLNKNFPQYYFQYTLNNYENENFEKNIPNLKNRIETFKKLSDTIGKDRIIWRYDPLILTDNINTKELLKRIEYIGDELKNYTNKLVYSYADISIYKKVKQNLNNDKVLYKEFTKTTMEEIAYGLNKLNKKWNFEIATCSENIDLEKYNIKHNKCIDDKLLIKLFPDDKKLMDFLGVDTKIVKTKNLKDKGQRKACGCIKSKDIGQYNTCPHECNYCYANTSKYIAKQNYLKHLKNKNNDSII